MEFFKKKVLLATKHPLTENNKPMEPTSAKQALHDPKWKTAMELEYEALMKNHLFFFLPA